MLLPTEDLENECLTSLVGQIFSELIIGNLVANKVSQPWLLWEILIILTRLVAKNRTATPPFAASRQDGPTESHSQGYSPESSRNRPTTGRKSWSFQRIFWSIVQWAFLAVNSIRLIISTMVLSRTLPPRPTPISVRIPESTGHYDGEKPYIPPTDLAAQPAPVKVAIIDFNIWPCVANLLELDVRMPWLGGALSMMQWGATRGPGRVAGYNGIIDR